MIQLQNVSVHRGKKQLLSSVSLTIHSGEHVGLVGGNGTGKSSLFQLLLGNIAVDAGDCSVPKDWRIGYMQQEISDGAQSALDYVIDGDQALRGVQKQLENCKDDVRLAQLYSELEHLDGYTAQARAATLLAGLGFSANDIEKPVSNFSGGWRVRLSLAQALMCPSDLLLLDEPTNHLDLGATLWLEGWLKHYAGTLIIVSHDRDFLDNVVDTIVHIEQEKLQRYTGNYSSFERQRSARLAQQQQLFEKQQVRIKHIEDFVRRFRAKASKAKQAQSRLKELERIDQVAPAHVDSPFDFIIPCADKIPKTLISLSDVTIGYPNGLAVEKVNFSLYDYSRIGLLGMNGAGKSTLLRSLAGELPLLAGTRVTGDTLQIGYFAQHQVDSLDLEASAFLHIQRISPKASEQSIRNFLGSFDFIGDRAFETVHHFSGGEKARLTLALIAWCKPNLLILDEPTNHLDLEMRHALTFALQSYEGAVIIVSHDRHLLRNTVDELFLVAHGKIEPYKDDLADYETWLAQQTAQSSQAETKTSEPDTKGNKKQQRQQSAELRSKLKPLNNQLKQLEKQLDGYHKKLSALETSLAAPDIYEATNKDKLQALLKEQAVLKQQMESCEETWLNVQEELELLEALGSD